MAAAAAHSGYLAPAADLAGAGGNINLMEPLTIDEDDSSLSSAGTDLSSRISSASSRKERWRLDSNFRWQQVYGSSESATSTSLSSLSPSLAADDAGPETTPLATPSRKRLSDGTLKPASPKLHQPPIPAPLPVPTHTLPSTEPPAAPPKKKRGRPPKIRPPVSETTEATPKTASASEPKIPRQPKAIAKPESKARPRSSIPSRVPADVFASECVEAAYESRLDPYSLHIAEQKLLAAHLTLKNVTVYLNIRNAILRLWQQNPLCSISADEAAGCAKETRFFELAKVAHKFLTRNGYINFGCVEVPRDPTLPKRFGKDTKQRTVAVIGAGVSGLTTARQLESLFRQEAATWISMGERPPRVVILEGRKRVGGRIYSKPLRSQVKDSLPDGLRNTAEMGAMIVTGFEHGNPLDTIIRGQLGLRYHLMRDALTIYDCNGAPVEEKTDMLNTELYTDISDRAGEYRIEPQKADTLHGDEDLINRFRDPVPDGYTALPLGALPAAHVKAHKPATRRGRRRNAPPGVEKLTGRSQVTEGESATVSASRAAKNMGWSVREGVAKNQSISLHRVATSSAYPTLGTVMDEAITQYQDLVNLSPLDMRLLNWHHANLEYANAAPVSQLSLSGHDQDTGNEFEGAHSEVIGGYTQVPRGLMNIPTKLDVRFNRIVDSIHYDDHDKSHGPLKTKIVCTDGEVIEADEVVMTAPLGVLKAGTIDFDPPLPHWKRGAIDRMGFGLLNKVILLYDSPFWDDDRDMFGLLNEAERAASLDPSDYATRRGRFYLIWNASKISGRPMLVALMAGNAAHDAEWTDTNTLMAEVTERLRSVFGPAKVPLPLEAIVTRWRRDPFTRGTYSYVGPETRPGDYDLMARSVGNLHFAGEATCGTHPATVHGAFLSGLRAASEVMDALAGTITLPDPLVPPARMQVMPEMMANAAYSMPQAVPSAQAPPDLQAMASWGALSVAEPPTIQAPAQPGFIKQEYSAMTPLANIPMAAAPAAPAWEPAGPPAKSVCASDPSFWVGIADASDLDYEAAVVSTILGQIGERPPKPSRPGVNPFLLFTKDRWQEAKDWLAAKGHAGGRDIIRQTIGQWWKSADEDMKQPYLVQSQTAQELADVVRRDYEVKATQWDKDAARIRKEYRETHPPPVTKGKSGATTNGVSKRKTNVSNCVVLDYI